MITIIKKPRSLLRVTKEMLRKAQYEEQLKDRLWLAEEIEMERIEL